MNVFILTNSCGGLVHFRKELLVELINNGDKVYIMAPLDDNRDKLSDIGCKFIENKVDRRGMNFLKDAQLIWNYIIVIKRMKPDVVLTYTIKPNIYGGFVTSLLKIPCIANVTGLGSGVERTKLLAVLLVWLYKIGFRKVNCIFFQNKHNMRFFKKNNIVKRRYRLIPGSGVNLKEFFPCDYPNEEKIEFVFISRIMKEKGIDEYLYAAEYIKKKYPFTVFHVCGKCEETYEEILERQHKKGIIEYHGYVDNVREIIYRTHCTINPSYHEGMSNVLLESAACGRPCLASDIPGCKEIVEEQKNGFLFESRNELALVEAIEKFIALSHEDKEKMGKNGRKKIEKEFDRRIIIDAYIDEINKIMEERK